MNTSTTDLSGPVPAAAALDRARLRFRVVTIGKADSLEEAAKARGVDPSAIVKTLVVRRDENDYVFVLVPGDRGIAWPKLRAALGVSRISMPDAEVAFAATGYRRGTITPFGASTPWPVVADATIGPGEISLGSGLAGSAIVLDAIEALTALNAQRADISIPLAR